MPQHDKLNPPKPQYEPKHPPQYEADLNPNRMAGQNIGEQERTWSASDIKELTRCLQDFTMDELREIRVLQPGARLEQGATYVDLKDPARKPFTALGSQVAGPDHWLIPKAEVPYPYWNRLLGIEEPTRTT
jgi:hypothetical protein